MVLCWIPRKLHSSDSECSSEWIFFTVRPEWFKIRNHGRTLQLYLNYSLYHRINGLYAPEKELGDGLYEQTSVLAEIKTPYRTGLSSSIQDSMVKHQKLYGKDTLYWSVSRVTWSKPYFKALIITTSSGCRSVYGKCLTWWALDQLFWICLWDIGIYIIRNVINMC